MKLGIITDMHLGLVQYGLKEREQDFYDQYLRAIDTFVNAEVDVVIMGGDVFDKARPSPKALEVFADGLSKLIQNGIKICNIIGNHAMVQAPGFVTADEFIGSVASFSEDYTLLDVDNYFETDDVLIMGLPYHYNFETDVLCDTIYHMNKDAGQIDKPSILVLHQSFKEFCGFDGEELSINDIETDNFDLIICGHIHEKKITQLDSGCVFLQPGSTERSSVAEARDEETNGKGIFLLDTDVAFNKDDTLKQIANAFYRLRSNRKFLIADMYMSEKDELYDIQQEIESNVSQFNIEPILFLTVHDSSGSFSELMDLTKEMRDICLTINFKYFDESIQAESKILRNGDIPTPREAVQIALNPLDKDEAQLGLDIYDLLKDGKDATTLLHKFLDNRMQELTQEEIRPYHDNELDEIAEYFEKI